MKKYLACAFAVGLIGLFAVSAFGQQKEDASAAPAAVPSANPVAAAQAGDESVEPKDLSIYGEVQAVDAGSNTLSVQYYNYDTDEEKTTQILVDKDTKIENAASLGDIKKGDWADVTYIVKNEKSVAKSIIVEKEEAVTEAAPGKGTPAKEAQPEAPAE